MVKFIDRLLKRFHEIPLETEFRQVVLATQERNKAIVLTHYYEPIAIRKVLQKDGYLLPAYHPTIRCMALSQMYADLADGKLTELFRLNERGH